MAMGNGGKEATGISRHATIDGVMVPSTDDSGLAEAKKFLGMEVLTLKKIIHLGLMFFYILFNYTNLYFPLHPAHPPLLHIIAHLTRSI